MKATLIVGIIILNFLGLAMFGGVQLAAVITFIVCLVFSYRTRKP